MLPGFFMIIDHSWRHKCGKNISDTLSCASCASSLFLPHFDVICDFLLNKRRATCKLFFKLTSMKCSLLLFSFFHFLSQNDTDIWSALAPLFNGYQNFLNTLLDILDSYWRKQLSCAFCIKCCHNYWVSVPQGFFLQKLSVHGLCDRNQSRITCALRSWSCVIKEYWKTKRNFWWKLAGKRISIGINRCNSMEYWHSEHDLKRHLAKRICFLCC